MHSGNKLLNKLAIPYIIWMVIFILLPLLLIFWYSITPSTSDNSMILRFTMENYTQFFKSSVYLVSFYRSLLLALVSTFFTLIIGYPMAMILANFKGTKRNVFLLLTIIPMWTNMLLRTYAWQYIISRNGLLNGFLDKINRFLPFAIPKMDIMNTQTAVILGMVYNFLPFMILPIFAVLVKLDKDLLNAAYDLGANKINGFIKITFPLSLPGIISGITLVFLPAATSFIIPTYLGGTDVYIGSIIEQQFKGAGNNPNFGSALSIILVVIIFVFTGLTSLFSSDKEKGESLW